MIIEHETLDGLQKKWPLAAVALSTVLVVYVIFLLVTTYLSVTALQKSLLEQAQQETERRTAALDYFFSERKDDLKILAASKEISSFFDARMRGVRISPTHLSAIPTNHVLIDLLNHKKIGSEALYARIALVDAEGIPLVDTDTLNQKLPGEINWKRLVAPELQQGAVIALPRQKDILVSRAYYQEDRYGGQLIAWVRTEVLYDHLLRDERAQTPMPYFVVAGKENVYLPAGGEMPPQLLALPDFGTIEVRKPLAFTFIGKDKDKRNMLALRIPVKNTTFSLLHLIAATDVTGQIAPWGLLLSAAIVFILFSVGLFVAVRIYSRMDALEDGLERATEVGRLSSTVQESPDPEKVEISQAGLPMEPQSARDIID